MTMDRHRFHAFEPADNGLDSVVIGRTKARRATR
jgi:hypothetical protein